MNEAPLEAVGASAAGLHATAATAGTAGRKSAKGAKAQADAAVERQVGHIAPANHQLAEQCVNSWFSVAPRDSVPDDFDMVAEPFALIAQDLTRFDSMRLVAADDSWLADLIVVDKGPGYALCKVVRSVKLPKRRSISENRVPEGFEVVQGGIGEEPWICRRLADGVVLNVGQFHHRREDAIRYLLDHATVRGEARPSTFGKRDDN